MLSVATSDLREIFAKIALPSCEGIACMGTPSTKYLLNGSFDSGSTFVGS